MFKQWYSFLIPLIILSSCNHNPVNQSYRDEIIAHRKQVNEEFISAKSPLLEEDRTNFTSLNFFTIDSTYRVKANVEHHAGKEPFQMPTSTDRLPWYQHVATLSFSVRDTLQTLEVYKNLDNKLDTILFIPFGDGTNGLSSYGSGRYLDVSLSKSAKHTYIDFNKAYNPYCAYNHKYSCPIPPRANQLTVYIPAGEKVFKHY
jgi:uncharacterized protein (DUF1684 family)